MTDLSDPIRYLALFVATAIGYVFAGAIDARLQIRHPAVFEELGPMLDTNAPSDQALPRVIPRLRFLLVDHLGLGDLTLSALCLFYVLSIVGLIAYFFLAG